MTISPLNRVIDHLTPFGYKLLPSPLVISGVKFVFSAVLAGPDRTSDLVIVADTADIDDDRILVRKVLAMARALDVARKSNPLTMVVVGPRPSQMLVAEMMSACRVLPVGALPKENADQVLRNWLAVLTPLAAFESNDIAVDPIAELRDVANDLRQDIFDLIALAGESADAVSEGVNTLFENDLASAWEEQL